MLVFYFTTKVHSHGGVQSLILNITRYMTSVGQKVKIIDRKDGYIHSIENEKNLIFGFLDIEIDDTPNCIDANDILISFGYFEGDIKFIGQKLFEFYTGLYFATMLLLLFLRLGHLCEEYHSQTKICCQSIVPINF